MLRLTDSGTTLTIGQGMTVRRGNNSNNGYPASIGFNPSYSVPSDVRVINQGMISADTSGRIIRVAGQNFLNAGRVEAGNGGQLTFLTPVQNAGQITAGTGPGNISISGNFTQSAAGIINVPIGGLTPGFDFSQLNVSGSATIDGTIAISLINGFVPTIGDQFSVLTSSSRFGVLSNLINPGNHFIPLYRTNGIVLLAIDAVAPAIITQPQNQTVLIGRTATLAVIATGTFPLGYQWRFGTTPIAGATGPFLMLSNVQPANAGNYSVVISNAYGVTTSRSATLALHSCQLPLGLVSWWPVDGNPEDFTGENEAVLYNGTAFVAGIRGQAFSFDGVDDYVRTPVNGMAFGTNDFSVEGWVRTTSTRSYNTIVSFDTYAPAIYIRSDGALQFYPQQVSSANGFNDGQWHHFAVTRQNGLLAYYKDGAPAGTTVDPRPITPSVFYIGADNAGDQFPGLIDELALYDRALSPSEIQSIYDTGSGGKCVPASPGAPVVFVNGYAIAASATQTNAAAIELQTSLPNGLIFFTLDGSSPQSGQLYTGPFSINESVALRAVAYSADFAMSAETGPVAVSIVHSPSIFMDPQSEVAAAGFTVNVEVIALGDQPLTYQWRRNGAAVSGATNSLLTLVNLQSANAGNYSVVVSNAYGSVTSAVAALTVIQPPAVETPPANLTVVPGDPALFCVTVSGDPPLHYQWRKNGVNIPGATNQCFSIPQVQVSDGGSYSVVVQNEVAAVVSAAAQLTVNLIAVPGGDAFASAIDIVEHCFSGSNGGATSQSGEPRHAGKVGGKSIWYKWFAPTNGIVTFETTGSSFDTLLAVYTGTDIAALTPVAADEDDAGFLNSRVRFNAVTNVEYRIAVDGYAGSEGTYAICWNLAPAPAPLPVLTTQPTNQTVRETQPVNFTVFATSAVPNITYQWFFNGASLIGETNSVLHIASVLPQHVGYYRVGVSNAFVGLLSDTAILEIGPVPGVQSVDKLPDLFAPLPPSAPWPGGGLAAADAPGVAISVSAGSTDSQVINNTGSATSSTEPLPCRVLGGASRWLLLQPTETATLRVDTIGSTIDTVLGVFVGASAATIVPLPNGCNDNGAADGLRSLVQFTAQAGVSYYIQADGKSGTNGIIRINWALGFAPATSQTLARYIARQGDSLALASIATGIPAPAFQWRRDNTPIAVTGPTLSLANIQPSDAGTYSVVVTNFLGAITSVVAILTVQSNAFAAAQDFFDSNHLPWTASANATITYQTSGGNPGGFLSFHAGAGGSQLAAPAEYLGNKFFCYNGLLSFDLRRSPSVRAYVYLTGSGHMLSFELPNAATTAWSSYKLLLDESAPWRNAGGETPRREEILAVLGSLNGLFIDATNATVDVDNLEFLAPTAPVLSVRRDAEAWLIQWPVPIGSCVVEATSMLGVGATWATVSAPLTIANNLNFMRIPSTPGQRFFRLRKL
jgi:hypothetical protein